MMQYSYKLSAEVYKLAQEATFIENEKCRITMEANTLTSKVYIEGGMEGYVLHGEGKFILDAIIETRGGAVGKSIVKELDKPFITITAQGRSLNIALSPATLEDLRKVGYENLKAFIEKADELLRKFFKKGRRINLEHLDRGFKVFAFPTNDTFEVLLASKDSAIYARKEGSYIFKGDKQVATGLGEVMISKSGKLVVIKGGEILVMKS